MTKRRRVFHLRLWGPAVRDGVDWEIEHHLEERIEELLSMGMTRAQAEAEARRVFGDMIRLRCELRDIDQAGERRMYVAQIIETMWQDVRLGLRSLRLNPTFALAVILTLGLGLGANVAMFTVVDALLLRPLPYRAPEELVSVRVTTQTNPAGQSNLAEPQARAFREQQNFLASTFLHARYSALYTGGVEAASLTVQAVTPEFEEVLGVQPFLGRGLVPQDAVTGAPHVTVVSHAFWRTALGSDRNVLEKPIVLDGVPHAIVGVMPKGFKFPEYATTDAWLPIYDDGTLFGRKLNRVGLLGRVAGGRIDVADQRAKALAGAIFAATNAAPGTVAAPNATAPSERSFRLARFDADRARGTNLHQSVWLLAGAVVLILLVSVVNVTNLLLMRATTRTRELAMRLSLGATRGRLLWQMITESLTLALLGGGLAMLIALATMRTIAGIIPSSIAFFAPHTIEIEQRALVFAFIATVACGLLIGIGPALSGTRGARTSGTDLSRYASRTRGKTRLRGALVASQVALSVTLLIGAGLLFSSFVRLMRVDPGFRLDNMAVLKLVVSSTTHPDPDERGQYLGRMEERIEALPGVRAVTVANGMPPSAGMLQFTSGFELEGQPARSGGGPQVVPSMQVRADFFEVTGARLLAGRAFNVTDGFESGHVIIDEDLARHLWSSEQPLGRRFRISAEEPWLTVVGVMADIKLMGADDRRVNFELLYPFGDFKGAGGYTSLAIRTDGDPRAVLPMIRAVIRELDVNQPIQELAPARVVYAEAIDMPRFLLVLMGGLALLALTLAGIGIYGVLSYSVSQRMHELCVRMALGARAGQLRRMVIGQGVGLAVIGAALGAGAALVLTRFIRSSLYGVQPSDPLTLSIAIVAMLAIASIACLQPARRAAELNAAAVLRAE